MRKWRKRKKTAHKKTLAVQDVENATKGKRNELFNRG